MNIRSTIQPVSVTSRAERGGSNVQAEYFVLSWMQVPSPCEAVIPSSSSLPLA